MTAPRRLQSGHAGGALLPLVRLQAHKSGTRIEIDMCKPVPRVVCDRAMIEQVLLNLTRNGIQAMEHLAPADERVLTLRVRAGPGQRVVIGVIDGGSGVDAAAAAQLYTPFFTTRREGMGLGLSVCRSIVEQHAGVLDFENLRRPNGEVCGAEFRFSLPAAGGVASPAVDASVIGAEST